VYFASENRSNAHRENPITGILLKAYDKYSAAPLTTVLDSEWDILPALHWVLQWSTRYPKITWVKSHQDDKEYDEQEMPLDAYLNSEADKLATTGLKPLQEKPIIPMDPNTIIRFHIRGRTITRDFKRAVGEIIQLPSVRKFYCKRFEWSNNIFDIIDWDIFRPVYEKYTSAKGVQWMHKFCIKKLPTGKRIHKRDHCHNKKYASYWHTLEDDNHIFQCNKRQSLRKKVINQINLMRNRINPRMRDILLRHLHSTTMEIDI
jgi:hypothetical protein